MKSLENLSNEELIEYKKEIEKKISKYNNLQSAKKVCL